MIISSDAVVKSNIMKIFFCMSKLWFQTRILFFPIYNFYEISVLSIKILDVSVNRIILV